MRTVIARKPDDQDASEISVDNLQRSLVDLIDLSLQAKQAHWNVVGPNFRAVHLQLDDLVAHLRNYSDTVAERIAALGQPAVGSGDGLFQQSKIDPFPCTTLRDEQVVDAVTERLAGVCMRIRERLENEPDPVSEDLLIDTLGTLEEQLWMFEAQKVRAS